MDRQGPSGRHFLREKDCTTIYFAITPKGGVSCEREAGPGYPAVGIAGSAQVGFSEVVNITHSLIKIGMTFSRFPVEAAKLPSNTGNFAGMAG